MTETYFLSSLESRRFEPVRSVSIARPLAFDTGKSAVLVRLDPPVVGQDFGRGDDVDEFVLAPRHAGVTLDPISEFPCFVFIALPVGEDGDVHSPLRAEDLQVIGWGEIYRTYEDARHHRFSK